MQWALLAHVRIMSASISFCLPLVPLIFGDRGDRDKSFQGFIDVFIFISSSFFFTIQRIQRSTSCPFKDSQTADVFLARRSLFRQFTMHRRNRRRRGMAKERDERMDGRRRRCVMFVSSPLLRGLGEMSWADVMGSLELGLDLTGEWKCVYRVWIGEDCLCSVSTLFP